jgi:hypothetical protein
MADDLIISTQNPSALFIAGQYLLLILIGALPVLTATYFQSLLSTSITAQ